MKEYIDVLKNKYAQFDGRARRREYWMFVLFSFLTSLVLGIIESITGLTIGEGSNAVGILSTIYMLAILVPSIALGIRRLHDIGKSGWWLLLALIPFLGGLILLIFACFDSEPGTNKYGPNPKGNVVASEPIISNQNTNQTPPTPTTPPTTPASTV